MSRSTFVRAAGAALALATALTAAPAAPAGATPAGRGATVVRVTASSEVVMPKTIRPGVVHVRVTQGSAGGVLFVRQKHAGLDTFLRLLNDDDRAAIDPRLRQFDHVDYVATGSDVWVYLQRGTYYVFRADTEGPYSREDITMLRVKGAPWNARKPRAASVVLDRNFRIPSAISTPYRTLRLVSHSSRFLALYALRIAGRATAAQVRSAIARPSFPTIWGLGAPNAVTEYVPTEVGPGHSAIVRTPFLARGRYFVYTARADRRARPLPGEVALLTVR